MLTPGEFREISPPLISVAETNVVKLFRKKMMEQMEMFLFANQHIMLGKEGD